MHSPLALPFTHKLILKILTTPQEESFTHELQGRGRTMCFLRSNSRSAFRHPARWLSPRGSTNPNLSQSCLDSSVLVMSWVMDSMLRTYSIASGCDSVLFI